jgi:chromosome segregation ATPase
MEETAFANVMAESEMREKSDSIEALQGQVENLQSQIELKNQDLVTRIEQTTFTNMELDDLNKNYVLVQSQFEALKSEAKSQYQTLLEERNSLKESLLKTEFDRNNFVFEFNALKEELSTHKTDGDAKANDMKERLIKLEAELDGLKFEVCKKDLKLKQTNDTLGAYVTIEQDTAEAIRKYDILAKELLVCKSTLTEKDEAFRNNRHYLNEFFSF